MNARSVATLSMAFLLSLLFSGCKDKEEAKAVLPKLCPYFPDSVIYKIDKRILWIQTNVDGISSATASALFEQACQKAAVSVGNIHINIATELNIDERKILLVGFKQYVVVWEVRSGLDERGLPRYVVMTQEQFQAWFTQHLGYAPQPDKILVVTLQDIQQTPQRSANAPSDFGTARAAIRSVSLVGEIV